MSNIKNNSAAKETRKRLLEAAGAVFADLGFHAATIKEITDRAGASLASVNYHFQDKAELYNEVLKRLAGDMTAVVPPDDQLTGSPAAKMGQFISYFCTTTFCMTKAPWAQVLLAREMAEPTDALNPLFEQVLHPLGEKLSTVIADLMDLKPSDPRVGLAAASVLGQCVYYTRHRHMITRMHPQFASRPEPETVAAHITRFSLAGIRALRVKNGSTDLKQKRAKTLVR